MRYGFINNFSQVLASALAEGATTMTLDGGGDAFTSATTSIIFPLTLFNDAGDVEIVHVTGALGNDLTIVGAQEGTTRPIGGWPVDTKVEMRVTANIMAGFAWGIPGVGVDPDSVSIQPSRNSADETATGQYTVAIGPESKAAGGANSWSVAVGYQAKCHASKSVCIGGLADAAGEGATAVGNQAVASDPSTGSGSSTAVGYLSRSEAPDGQAIGSYCSVEAEGGYAGGYGASVAANYATALGWQASASAASESGVALGHNAALDGAGSVVIGNGATNWGGGQIALGPNSYPGQVQSAMSLTAMPMLPASIYGPLSYQHNVAMRMSVMGLVRSDDIDLATTGDKGSITFPTGATFFVEAIDVIVTSSAAGGATPTINVGTLVSGTDILAAHQLTDDTVGSRVRALDVPHGVGVSEVHFSVSAAAASAMEVRFIVHGYMMES